MEKSSNRFHQQQVLHQLDIKLKGPNITNIQGKMDIIVSEVDHSIIDIRALWAAIYKPIIKNIEEQQSETWVA